MSSKAFNHQVFRWVHQVNHDKRLLAIDLCVAVELTNYFDEKDQGGRAWPKCKTVSDAIGLHETTILRSVRRLEVTGHLRVIWGRQGRGHSSQYWMIIKPAEPQVLKPAVRQRKKPAAVQETLKGTPTEEPKGSSSGWEREALAAQASSPAERKAASPVGAPRSEESARSSAPDPIAPPEETTVHAAWRALLELWSVRPWPTTPREVAIARTLFVKAVANGTPVDAILAGAGAWVSGVDGPRYLTPLAQWLAARSWEFAPPPKRTRRSPSASHWQRTRSAAEAMADLAREAAS